MRIHLPTGELSSRFLHYFLRTNRAVDWLQGQAVGATMSNLNAEIVRRLPIRYPSARTQSAVVDVLDSIGDLIENNRRRIALLEQMAQAIYREWFVHLGYPGHEDDELVDSPVAPVPAGWEVLPVSLAVEINPTVSGHRGSDVPFVAMADLDTGLMHVTPSSTRRFGGGGSKFEKHDTLFARITPSVENGKTGFVQFLADGDVAMGSTEFLVFRGRRISAYSTYLLTRREDLRLHAVGSMSGASGRQRVNNACFDTFAIPVPPPALEQSFADRVAPMFAAVEVLSQTNIRLARLRDLLLPKLVTGAIDVSKLELDALLEEPAA
jgi:type I restriction enzyme S subunit